MKIKKWIQRHPVVGYVLLCYGISWSIWFAIPWAEGENWTLIKILVGVGLGPGLAAIVLDRLRGTAGPVNRRWWGHFAAVFTVVLVIHLWSLLTGDARVAEELAAAEAPGVSFTGLAGAALSAAACGFIFASAAASRVATLNSVTRWRSPLRWWLIALFLPAAINGVGWVVAAIDGSASSYPLMAGLLPTDWLGFVVRSTLFTLLVVGLGEETGWRGWMLPELQRRFSPLTSSIVVGVVWGFWHLPLFFNGAYEGDLWSVLEYVVLGPIFAVLFTWLFNRTGGSLLLAIVLHAAVNNTPRAMPTTEWFPVAMTAFAVVVLLAGRMWRQHPHQVTPGV